jgi:uncharacterized damage-inducible protein DinB
MTTSALAHYLFTQACNFTQVCNNAWSNRRLLTACERLSQADFVAAPTSFFPSRRN